MTPEKDTKIDQGQASTPKKANAAIIELQETSQEIFATLDDIKRQPFVTNDQRHTINNAQQSLTAFEYLLGKMDDFQESPSE